MPDALEIVDSEVRPAPREQSSWVPPVPPEASTRSSTTATSAPPGRTCGARSPRWRPSWAGCSGRPSRAPASISGPRPRRRPPHPLGQRAGAGSRLAGGAGQGRPWPAPRSRLRRGAEPASDRGDDRRSRVAQVGPGLERGHRRARLPALALAPPLGPAGDDHRLVAGDRLIGLPVSRGACGPKVS